MTAKKPLFKSTFEMMLYLLLGVIIILRFYGAYQDAKVRQSGMIEQAPAPAFTWRDFSSDKHEFIAVPGKVIILHFWASWCVPCRQEFPALLHAANILKDDAVFLTLSGDDSDAAAKKFLLAAKNAAGIAPDNVLYGWDPMKSIIFDTFKTTAFPETYIIDTHLNMRRKLVGLQLWSEPKLINYIHDLKNEHANTEVPKAP